MATDTAELTHWVGEWNNTLHGNGAGSKDMKRTSGDEDEVTCTLCRTLLEAHRRELLDAQRVTATPGALYSNPRRASKRRRCDGHLAREKHWINVGDPIVWSALPPDHGDIGNIGWWHNAFCADCAPATNTQEARR